MSTVISSKEKAYPITREGYEYNVWQSQKKKKKEDFNQQASQKKKDSTMHVTEKLLWYWKHNKKEHGCKPKTKFFFSISYLHKKI